MERVTGIEPVFFPWKGNVGPFNYTRNVIIIQYLSEYPDSNRGPPRPKRGALPAEPYSDMCRGKDSNLHASWLAGALKAPASTIPPPRLIIGIILELK